MSCQITSDLPKSSKRKKRRKNCVELSLKKWELLKRKKKDKREPKQINRKLKDSEKKELQRILKPNKRRCKSRCRKSMEKCNLCFISYRKTKHLLNTLHLVLNWMLIVLRPLLNLLLITSHFYQWTLPVKVSKILMVLTLLRFYIQTRRYENLSLKEIF